MIKKQREPDTRKGYARKYTHFRRFVVVNKRQQTVADQPAQLDLSTACENEVLGFPMHVQKQRSGGPFGPKLEPKMPCCTRTHAHARARTHKIPRASAI